MKKLVLGLLAAALVTLGLVGAPSAQADPYPGTVAVAAPAIVKSKATKKAKIQLTTPSGNVVPNGPVKVVCKTVKGAKKTVKNATTVGSTGIVKTGKLGKGKWTCKVNFPATSVFKDTTTTVKVK